MIPLIDSWLMQVRKYVEANEPAILPTLDIYIGEARFGREFIDSDLKKLSQGASVLEVGAGSMLLSCQLVREGVDVTALEPTGEGFGHFARMRELILQFAQGVGCSPKILSISAERLQDVEKYDYVFSINVMEHVQDVSSVIANVAASMKPGAVFHFTCPNYLFPYEPHFNIPTLLSKKLTGYIFRKRIRSKDCIYDSIGLWNSLNWINVWQIRAIVQKQGSLHLVFDKKILVRTLERMKVDALFAARRSAWVRILISWLVKCRLHLLAEFMPAAFQPVIDCSLMKSNETVGDS